MHLKKEDCDCRYCLHYSVGKCGLPWCCCYEITGFNILNRYKPGFGCHQCSRYEALNHTKFLSDKLHTAGHNAACDAYFKCFFERWISTVSDFFGCCIGCCTDRALNKTDQRRCRARHSRRKCADDCSAGGGYSDSLPVDFLSACRLRNNT